MSEDTIVDMGFPRYRPDCEGDPTQYRCVNSHFSDLLLDLVILVCVNSDNPMKFDTNTDVYGKSICQPASFFKHNLDQKGRNWLVDQNRL